MTNINQQPRNIEVLFLVDDIRDDESQFGKEYCRYRKEGLDPDYVIVQGNPKMGSHSWPDVCADNQCFFVKKINEILQKEGFTDRRFEGIMINGVSSCLESISKDRDKLIFRGENILRKENLRYYASKDIDGVLYRVDKGVQK